MIDFRNATICRGVVPILQGFNWEIHAGESWAIIGPTGSGKTTLAEVLVGQHCLAHGSFTHQLSSPDLSQSVRFIPFREQSRLFRPEDFYYQQRFEFGDPDDCPTVRQYLAANRPATDAEFQNIVAILRIGSLLDRRVLKLSNGQMRRVRLARGLLGRPQLLILDDPFAGLDLAGRTELADLLQDVHRAGQQLILVMRRNQVPNWLSCVLDLAPFAANTPTKTDRVEHQRQVVPVPQVRQPVIELRDVHVQHGGTKILDGIHWTVHAGERWAVLGPNGSGKSTLLSLICGDHPQAHANEILLFHQRRGLGETIWDVKRKIGFVSPELHQYFPRLKSAWNAAATGFFDHLTPQPLSTEQSERLAELFAEFNLTEIAQRPWWQLSTGQQRGLLFIRAILKRPPILILDEPFQGMDEYQIARFRNWLDANLTWEQTLLLVSHQADELPVSMTHRLMLQEGRVVEAVPITPSCL
jgi:molybdate transport system ATP-binding protein